MIKKNIYNAMFFIDKTFRFKSFKLYFELCLVVDCNIKFIDTKCYHKHNFRNSQL